MVSHNNVLGQLNSIGLKFSFFGRSEVKELADILNEGEIIRHCTYGYYQGGSALLVATDGRLLLIDKKPFFLNLEDLRYEMINEVDFAGRFLDATVSLHTGNRKLAFRSFTDARLRELCRFTQDQITRARQIEYVQGETNNARGQWRPYSMVPTTRGKQT